MRTKRLVSLMTLLVAAVTLAPNQLAHADDSNPDPQFPEGVEVLFSGRAYGVQIYDCQGVFQRPFALVTGEIVHYGPGGLFQTDIPGPRWRTFGEQGASTIIGQVAPGGTFPNSNPQTTIPDLLINVINTQGEGPLSEVTNVMRLDTRGGAYSEGAYCNGRTNEVRVPYTTTYVFGYRP